MEMILEWAGGWLDPLGTEGVRRYLEGEKVAQVSGTLPPPRQVGQERHDRGRPGDALELAVVALRVASGIAWWKIAARYVLANTPTPRDEVSGTWGNAGRRWFARGVGVDKKAANQVATSGSDVNVTSLATSWGVGTELGTSVLGPGAPNHFTNIVQVGHHWNVPLYRLEEPESASSSLPDEAPERPAPTIRSQSRRSDRSTQPSDHPRKMTTSAEASSTPRSPNTEGREEPRLPNPSIDHQAGTFMHGTVEGPHTTEHVDDVDMPGFRLAVTQHGEATSVQTVTGAPSPEQVLRGLGRAGVLQPVRAPEATVAATLHCDRAMDRAIYSADLQHRLLYQRIYDESGPEVTWFGINPFLADLEGDPTKQPPRPSFRNMVGVANGHLGQVGTFNILNLYTRRSHQVVDISQDTGDRLRHDDVVRDAVANSDLVIAAWGGSVKARHLDQVRVLLHVLDELNKTLHVRAKDGVPLMTTGSPPQPQHARMGGYKHITLVEAPTDWRNQIRGTHRP